MLVSHWSEPKILRLVYFDDFPKIKLIYMINIKESLEIGMEAKNFTNYLIYINVYMIVLILTYFFFFNTELKRSKVRF